MPPPTTSPLILYRGWPTPGRHVWSPFVVKLETRLRLAGVAYECRAGNPLRAPRGKIPYVDLPPATGEGDGQQQQQQLGDSALITRHLVARGVLPDLNAGLSPEQRGLDLATRALLEDKLFFYHTRERWLDNYHAMRDHVLSAVPWPARLLVGRVKHRGFYRSLYGQGTLRYSRREARAAKEEVWQGVGGVLSAVARARGVGVGVGVQVGAGVGAASASASASARAPFWFLGGDDPTEVDATLFGFLVSVLMCSAGPESRQIVGQHPILLDYAERIHDRYFPDYSKWESGAVEQQGTDLDVHQEEASRLTTAPCK